jgi:hypothetical protein
MISQRTVGCLQTLLEWLFNRGSRVNSLWSWSQLKLALYKEDVNINWLDYIYEECQGIPQRFLPLIYDGTIPAYVTRSNSSWQPAPNDEDKALGQALIALIIQATAARVAEVDRAYMDEVLASLKLDGYELIAGKVTLATVSGVDLQYEEDYLLSQIRQIGPANLEEIRHHYDEAVKTFVNKNWGSSSTENRNFFVALLRGLREVASTRGGIPAFNQPGKDGPLINDFQTIGMLTEQEKDAVLKVWVLLCHSGPHVGIKEEESALLGRIFVLGMTRWVCLKFEDWSAKGFKNS